MASILSTVGVTKRFGGLVAVSSFDVEVEENSISAVIGPNGAGKTTFFNCITGFYVPEEGKILFGEREIQGLSTDQITRSGISRTYQNIRLFANMTAIENILVGQHPRLKTSWISAIFRTRRQQEEEAQALEEANRLLRYVGLAGLGDHLAHNLPYGAQRRLEIARALANLPALLLLDEPTAGMNPQESSQLMQLIRRIRDQGVTVLIIEHDMKVMMNLADSIYALDHGELIAYGTPDEIRANPRVIEAYLGVEEE